jgi:hypothetical protein
MKKKCKVVMLATDSKSTLFIGKTSGQLHELAIPDKDESTINQHLYILSDDEIKECDWISDGRSVWHIPVTLDGYINLYKIIATTDSSLSPYLGNDMHAGEELTIKLPSIPQSFIDKYVSEYNKGNKIKEVMVEYINNYDDVEILSDFEEPKLNPDNTINISTIKDSWTREEVIALIKKYGKDIHKYEISEESFNEWIETNL